MSSKSLVCLNKITLELKHIIALSLSGMKEMACCKHLLTKSEQGILLLQIMSSAFHIRLYVRLKR